MADEREIDIWMPVSMAINYATQAFDANDHFPLGELCAAALDDESIDWRSNDD